MADLSKIDRKATRRMYLAAKNALEERKNTPKSKQGALSPSEAKKQGIRSGVTTARNIIRSYLNKTDMSWDQWGAINRFGGRFGKQPTKSPAMRQAKGTWGGSAGFSKAKSVMAQKERAEKK